MLQLLQIKKKSDSDSSDGTEDEYGEFLHLPGKRFYDFNDIRKEIQVLLVLFTLRLTAYFNMFDCLVRNVLLNSEL